MSTETQRTREQLMAELRTLIPAMGIREAARQLGVKEDTALSWARRYGWTADPAIKSAIERIPRYEVALHSNALTGAQSLASSMRDDAVQGRASALRITRRTLGRVERMDDDELIVPEVATMVHTTVKSASIAGGYASNQSTDLTGKAFGKRGHVIEVDPDSSVILQELDTEECSTAETGQIGSDYQG